MVAGRTHPPPPRSKMQDPPAYTRGHASDIPSSIVHLGSCIRAGGRVEKKRDRLPGHAVFPLRRSFESLPVNG